MSAGPTTFGKYYLAEKIATGGMAEIYLAKLLGPGGFEKTLIIKQILGDLGTRAEFIDLFVKEAKTLVGLSHGNIVPIYELGVIEGTYFIAMEYIDGPTLAELCLGAARRDESIAPSVAAFVLAEIMRGLAYAHRKGAGLVHRDLSPRNVMVSRDGEVKLVDFGIAATLDEAQSLGSTEARPIGSFPYMSPEQVRGEPLDARSDLFSAGVLLWEVLTGANLFHRESAEATLAAVLQAPVPPPSSIRPDVPEALDRVCERALARDAAERYASAADFLRDLTRYLYTIDPPLTSAVLPPLVARLCPPEVAARHEAEPAADGERDDEHSDGGARGDGTRPMPGRRPPPPGPTRTFATSVAFEEAIRNATPLMAFDAIDADVEKALDDHERATRATEAGSRRARTASLEPALQRSGTTGQEPPASAEPAAPAATARGWTRGLVAAAIVTAAVAGLWVALGPETKRPAGADDAAERPRAADARVGASERPDAKAVPNATTGDANAAEKRRTDAGRVPSDRDSATGPKAQRATDTDTDNQPAANGRPTAAGPAPPQRVRDAGSPVVERPPAVRSRGTLSVGAQPWGDVFVDGERLGTTPGSWPVPAGRHRLRIVHPPSGQRRELSVEVRANETTSPPLVVFDLE